MHFQENDRITNGADHDPCQIAETFATTTTSAPIRRGQTPAPFHTAPADDQRVRYQGYFRRASGEVARQLMTHSANLLPPVQSEQFCSVTVIEGV